MPAFIVALLLAVLEGGPAEERARAFSLLRGLLPAAAPQIRACIDHPDAELRGRCRELLAPSPLPASPVIARLAFIDEKQGRVAGDLREKDGAREGQFLIARRDGRRLGTLLLVEVHPWGCWLEARQGATVQDLQRGDTLHWR